MILIVSQIIGFAAVFLYLLSYQLKKRTQIVWVTCFSNVLYVLQYLLLGAFSGAVMDVLSAVSSFFAAKKNEAAVKPFAKWIAAVNLFFITAAGLVIVFLREDVIELLPIAGALFQTGGLWCEREQTIRKLGFLSAPFWLVYNFISMAYGAALGSVLAMVSILVSLYRYREKTIKNEVL